MIERRYIFFPERPLLETPEQWGLQYEEVRFPASDGVRLHGWYVPGRGDLTWIWFHGNAGNIGHRLENLMLLHRRLGVNIFLFDYRGYGRSEGKVSEKGTYRDARAALEYVVSQKDTDPHKLVYFGRSLGAAIAVELATQLHPRGLILESPFTSIKDMAKKVFPLLPLYLLVRTKYDSLSRIDKVSCPLLIIHGDMDEIVPIGQAMKLYERAQEPKQLYVIPGAGHSETYLVGEEPYFSTLAEFLASFEGLTGTGPHWGRRGSAV